MTPDRTAQAHADQLAALIGRDCEVEDLCDACERLALEVAELRAQGRQDAS